MSRHPRSPQSPCRTSGGPSATLRSATRRWCLILVALTTHVSIAGADEYHIGPNQTYESPFEAPWYLLEAGDTVVIHWRPKPYKAKFVLSTPATAEQPLTVRGEPGPNGELPVITGKNALTPPTLSWWSADRAIISIGYSSVPDQGPASHIIVENLDITGAHPNNHFLGEKGLTRYSPTASAIYVESGSHITIRNCILRDSANGFFSAFETENLLVEGCDIHSNGMKNSYYQHNSYSAGRGVTFQFNHFGPLADGAGGSALKDRSAGLIVRYNWIDGGNRQLDLVEAEDSETLVRDPRYGRTFVYGNTLVERPDDGNNQIVHYGGDTGNESIYRKGVLYFFNNTVISHRTGSTVLMKLSSSGESAQVLNNILMTTAKGNRLALLEQYGIATVANNWIKTGAIDSHEGGDYYGRVIRKDNIEGESPGIVNLADEDFRPTAGSPLIDASAPVTFAGDVTLPVDWEFAKPRGARQRPQDSQLDIGAFELRP